MKKLSIGLTVLLLCTAGATFGQAGGCMVPGTNVSCLNAYFGVMVGGMWATITGKGPDEQGISIKRKTGLLIGGFFNYEIMNNVVVQPEFKYVQMGMKKTHSDYNPDDYGYDKLSATDADDPSNEVAVSYIQVPILVKYTFPTEGNIKPSILLGPSVAINVSAKDKQSGWGGDSDGEFDIINAKKFGFSGIIGAGVLFPVGEWKFGVDVRYDRGLTNVFDDVTQDELDNLDAANETYWTGDAPANFGDDHPAWEAKNSGFSISFNMILPIGAGKSDDDGN